MPWLLLAALLASPSPAATTAAAGPAQPLAREGDLPSKAAEAPAGSPRAGVLDRLRVGGGLSFEQARLRAPGGSGLGPALTVVLEGANGEAALSLGLLSGLEAQDPSGRATPLSGAQLRLSYRVQLSRDTPRVLLEAGGRAGVDRSLGACTSDGCALATPGFALAALAGALVQVRTGPAVLTAGSDLLVFLVGRGARDLAWEPAAPFASRLGLAVYLEVSLGGAR